jgi:hypothetical protein
MRRIRVDSSSWHSSRAAGAGVAGTAGAIAGGAVVVAEADYVVYDSGAAIPMSQDTLENGSKDARYSSYPNAQTKEPATIYVDPDSGKKYRVKYGSTQNRLRLVTHAPTGNALMPDGSNVPGNVKRPAVKDLTHFLLR